ncbi:MAG: DNA-protecting protein DprA [Actinobacteria bacterium]|jgi:DNA processing protein|nr:DNA-protecting protein DprA [Actinomycetota bacterium]NCV41971.1 DNA-protecting protein DprA [Actinomycetota bacterium]NCV82745.1 DNA-protecting protein DprA [Actinomycetota bacterium]NCW91900.1 DNA-protecting protein DprA [Actinomycetota bacterium]NCX16333.1 DNA-protecting protein DprA [Actinomycetota bacterium]
MYIQTPAFLTPFEARAILFSCIEPGHFFWSAEISAHGPLKVLESILSGNYAAEKTKSIIDAIRVAEVDQILSEIEKAQAQFLTPEHEHWPIGVNQLINPPIGLIVKGNSKSLITDSLAIVGSRKPTNYGANVASEFARGFSDLGWTIISGGAYGIDSYAHRATLQANGRTIAVLATGIEVAYPKSNQKLFNELSTQGALISELMPYESAMPSRFLVRNRLIASIAKATLVVEAAYKSGSLRTAHDAAELLRPVMAIPGPINSAMSQGCHRLISERAAELITSVADAVEFIGANQ